MNAAWDPHVHSGFSTFDGMGSPETVVQRAKELGWGAVSLCEHGWMGSTPALYAAAKKAGIKPIIGCEFYVCPEEYLVDGNKQVLEERRHLTVLALSTEGYHNLVAWQNASFQRPLYYNGPRLSLERMVELAPWPLHHNVVLSGCLGSELCQTLLQHENPVPLARLYVEACKTIFPNFYIEIQQHEHRKWYQQGFERYDAMCDQQLIVREALLALARASQVPILVSNDSHYQRQEQRAAHVAMLSTKTKKPEDDYIYQLSYMREIEPIAERLPAWAGRQALANAEAIVAEADVRLDPLDQFSYAIPRAGYPNPISTIRRRSSARLKQLILRHGQGAFERFERELEAMGEFANYLLMMADFIQLTREQGIYTWTRGSAANSIVCFCLGIHEIDSIHYNLMFERFVNPARKKLPDIDIDFEDHRRDDVVKLARRLVRRYEGANNVRAICTYGTLANRTSFRLMAKASGVEEQTIDEMARLLPQMIDSGMVDNEAEAYELLREEFPDLYELASEIFDAIASVGQHACGIVFGTKQRKLEDWVPNYRIGSSDTLVTQYNMKWLEEMGFVKGDFLKLATLSVMHDIARMVGKDMAWLDEILRDGPGSYAAKDKKTYAMLRAGLSDGVHSFQGASQRRGCSEVGIESDRDAIAIQALYRPSGTRSGADKSFCNRKHGREQWVSLNPFVGTFLDETYGIAIFQEQIMEMGAAMGMGGAQIDQLYKAIKTAKGVGRGAAELFEQFEPIFMRYASEVMSQEECEQLWAQWETLQGYMFVRGHATSYGILAIKSAYLLAHYPREALIALLKRYPDNARYMAAVIERGMHFESPDVNSSGEFCKGTSANAIQLGLARIAGVGPAAVREIIRQQPYRSVDDLIERTDNRAVTSKTINLLQMAGALGSLGIVNEGNRDLVELELMRLVLQKPAAFEGCKPQFRRRGQSSWRFSGLENGVRLSEGKSFCAKLFWIPPWQPQELLSRQSSAMGQGSALLLKAVDVNGIPFDLMCYESERKQTTLRLLHVLAEQAAGAVICAEGQLGMPFLRGGLTSFRIWGISGAEDANPLIWHSDQDVAQRLIVLAQEKANQQRGRRAA